MLWAIIDTKILLKYYQIRCLSDHIEKNSREKLPIGTSFFCHYKFCHYSLFLHGISAINLLFFSTSGVKSSKRISSKDYQDMCSFK